jgi:hypothetical protein
MILLFIIVGVDAHIDPFWENPTISRADVGISPYKGQGTRDNHIVVAQKREK